MHLFNLNPANFFFGTCIQWGAKLCAAKQASKHTHKKNG